jgi:ribosomal protein S18 acetylase RimI-like enzyme
VADSDGKLAGAVSLYLEMPKTAREEWPADWAGIRMLAVHPRFRGRGIGAQLVQECIARCKNHGAGTIALHTTKEMIVARRLYEAAGFQRMPQFDFQPLPDVRVIAYRLDIS